MTPPIQAVLFDCDGVLADSETLVNRLIAEELTARGWPMDGAGAQGEFLGLAMPAVQAKVEQRLGAPLPPGWIEAVNRHVGAELARKLEPVPGAAAALEAVAARGLPMACCSNSAGAELRMKLAMLGFAHHFAGRLYGYDEVAHPKPAPDLYLTAARACGVPPEACLVVEDSAPGVAAARAAGCQVLEIHGAVPDLAPYLAARAA